MKRDTTRSAGYRSLQGAAIRKEWRMTVRKKCAPINWPSAEEIEAERDRKANQLVRRGDIIKICEHFARDHADLALYGEVDQARCREAAEAMATAIRCAVALIPEANSGGQFANHLG